MEIEVHVALLVLQEKEVIEDVQDLLVRMDHLVLVVQLVPEVDLLDRKDQLGHKVMMVLLESMDPLDLQVHKVFVDHKVKKETRD